MIKMPLARDLMKSPVRQLTVRTPVRDAAAFLLRHGISGAPVLDEHGQWIGVFTQNDIARYVQDRIQPVAAERSLQSREAVEGATEIVPDRFGMLPVQELMTVGLYTVFPEATLEEVIHALTAFKVHRVFVIEDNGNALLGVITTMDVLRWMDAHRGRAAQGRKPLKS
jgi:CBS domain-containing protein